MMYDVSGLIKCDRVVFLLTVNASVSRQSDRIDVNDQYVYCIGIILRKFSLLIDFGMIQNNQPGFFPSYQQDAFPCCHF
jgi:hypothetical protein